MRTGFIVLRFISYVSVFLVIVMQNHLLAWQWVLSLACMAWATSEHWKHPTDTYPTLRLGAWVELLFILAWSISLQDNVILFLAISPIVRSDVHLFCRDAGWIGGVTAIAILIEAFTLPSQTWLPWLEATVIGTIGLHGFLLGSLLRDRERLARLERIALQERAASLRDQERIQLAGQLHDVMGQYWTAVIRGLDAVIRTTGESQHVLIVKVQDIAVKGLQEMRDAVHTWHGGRRSDVEWMAFLTDTIQQWREIAGIDVNCRLDSVDWHRFENPAQMAEVATRVAVEAMTNSIRHADPVRLELTIQATPETLSVEVRDVTRHKNSAHPSSNSSGIGNQSMEHIVDQVGGHLIRKTAQSGTTVKLVLPFPSLIG